MRIGILVLILVAFIAGGACSTTVATPPAKVEVESPPLPEESVFSESQPLTDVQVQEAWLRDVFRETSGMLLHREPNPKSMTIGGIVWTRSNETTTRKARPYGRQHIYTCEDPKRRLAVFFDPDPPGYPDSSVALIVDEHRLLSVTWEVEGICVTCEEVPRRTFFCANLSRGGRERVSTLTPHHLGDDGTLVPNKLPVESLPGRGEL